MIRPVLIAILLASPVVACNNTGYTCSAPTQSCYTTTHHEPTFGSRIKQRLAGCLLKRLRNRSYSSTQCCPQQTQQVAYQAPAMQSVECQVPVTTYRTEQRERTVTKLVPQEVTETYNVQVPETTYETRTMQVPVPVQASECCQPVQQSACKYQP